MRITELPVANPHACHQYHCIGKPVRSSSPHEVIELGYQVHIQLRAHCIALYEQGGRKHQPAVYLPVPSCSKVVMTYIFKINSAAAESSLWQPCCGKPQVNITSLIVCAHTC